MQYPALVVNYDKLVHNTRHLVTFCRERGIEICVVTKVFCAIPDIVNAIVEGGAETLADSRTENLEKLQRFEKPLIMLRLPMASEAERVVEFADISLNSERHTLAALSAAAVKRQKEHGVILMAELGDLREGALLEDLPSLADLTLRLPGLRLYGVGVNLNCYGGVIPDEENLSKLAFAAAQLEKTFNLKLKYVSGGNSGAVHLLYNDKMPRGINHLRIGEALLLGAETSYGKHVPGLHTDVFTLRAECIESKYKPSVPTGNLGKNAFGQIPEFEDKGIIKRAIFACGRQDTICDQLVPRIPGISYVGSSSDHMIWDVTDAPYPIEAGDIVEFSVPYGALLGASTSDYVKKVVVKSEE